MPPLFKPTTTPGGIVLTTLNARYRHPSLGLRCLKANLEELMDRCIILEFTIHDRPVDIVESILNTRPAIIGIGVTIWNLDPIQHVLALIKQLSPQTMVVLGGPEAGHTPVDAPWHAAADVIVTGEGEITFREVCRKFYAQGAIDFGNRRISAPPVDLAQVALPYSLYDAEDLAHRWTYVEASRGCPYGCAFCLSAQDAPVRRVPEKTFLAALEGLLQRGANQFKFVDRTFNLNTALASAILDFFHERLFPGLFLHFEMIPDHLPPSLKDRLASFPEGCVQLEIGLQTLDPQTLMTIHRTQNNEVALNNLVWLRNNTHAHLHTDLIFGLPGESLGNMEAGFNRLLRCRPHAIQVGILKRLHGTRLAAQDPRVHGMIYNPRPPYDVLANDQIDFATMQRLRRFARFWDLIGNSNRFPTLIEWLGTQPSPFVTFLHLSDFIFTTYRQTHAIALSRLIALVQQGLKQALKLDQGRIREIVGRDWPDRMPVKSME
ncbi:MAG: DUF4080 domain-containing protein [Magnetococcales bacterium]|nr:DUF4080 domain-containing protein [Magnetococcales bacterium]